MSLGSNIRSARRGLRLSQEQLARKAGIASTYLGRIETGEANPTINVLTGISKALDVPLVDLMGGDVTPKNAIAHLKIQKELPVEATFQFTESPTIKAMLDDRRDRLDAIESLVSALMKDSVPVAKIKALIALVEVE